MSEEEISRDEEPQETQEPQERLAERPRPHSLWTPQAQIQRERPPLAPAAVKEEPQSPDREAHVNRTLTLTPPPQNLHVRYVMYISVFHHFFNQSQTGPAVLNVFQYLKSKRTPGLKQE